MNRLFISLVLLCVISNSAFAHIKHDTEQTAIRHVLSNQQQAWNNGDLEQFMQGYWQSEKLRFASGNSFRFGWKTTLANYQKNYPDRTTMGKLTFDIIDIKLIAPQHAIVFGRWHLQREKDTPNGLFSLTFEKISGQWLITQDHTSSE